MDNELVAYARRFMTLSDEEAAALSERVPLKFFAKGTILLRDGEIASSCYFILKGCVREYRILEGEEHTTAFFTEEQAVVSFTSFVQGTPCNHYWECIEDTQAVIGTMQSQTDMFRDFPRFETFTRNMMEQDFGKTQEAMAAFMTMNAEERYLHLLKTRPALLQRVPLHQLASFLGVKPESLSRIRRRVASRKDD